MFLIVESHRKDLPYGQAAGHFYDMNVCQISIPKGLPGQSLIKLMPNIDLSKSPEQLWYSTLKHLAGSLRGQRASITERIGFGWVDQFHYVEIDKSGDPIDREGIEIPDPDNFPPMKLMKSWQSFGWGELLV